jgi:hypothetical protein
VREAVLDYEMSPRVLGRLSRGSTTQSTAAKCRLDSMSISLSHNGLLQGKHHNLPPGWSKAVMRPACARSCHGAQAITLEKQHCEGAEPAQRNDRPVIAGVAPSRTKNFAQVNGGVKGTRLVSCFRFARSSRGDWAPSAIEIQGKARDWMSLPYTSLRSVRPDWRSSSLYI